MAVPIAIARAWMNKHAELIVSPAGWAVSIVVGALVLRRVRVLGRR